MLSSERGTDHTAFLFCSFWRRLTATGSLNAQKRFIDTFELYFNAVTQQNKDKMSNTIPDLESYIATRRDTSGCKPCWALIEYANNVRVEPSCYHLLPPRAKPVSRPPRSSIFRTGSWTTPSSQAWATPPTIWSL